MGLPRKVRARLAAAVESVLRGIVSPGWHGPRRGATRSNVEPLEQRVFLSTTPAWLATGSAATWDPNTDALLVTGPAAIVADPGTDEPLVTVSGSGAALAIEPTTDTWIHLGGLNLTNGGRAEVTRPNANSFDEAASLVLELGVMGSTAATPLSIDSGGGSTLGLEDNDLIVRGGSDAVPAYLGGVAVQVADLASSIGTLNPAGYHQDALAMPDAIAAADWGVVGRRFPIGPGDALIKYLPAGQIPDWPTPVDTPESPTGIFATREQIGPRYVASMFAQADLASGPMPAYVVSAVVNGNLDNLAGPQRSMVDSVLYTFSEPVTLNSTAFSIAVQIGQTGTLPTLAWTAVSPDASGASDQWAVTFGGASVIGGSIANGVYVLTLDSMAVISEANPSVPAQAHNPDIFSRLFGDGDGNGAVDSNSDYAQFQAALATYSPIFDYDASGTVSTLDYAWFKRDLGLTYAGTISFSPAALRPTDVSAAVNGPNSVTLSWTGPADPNVTGYTIQRWSGSEWVTLPETVPAAPVPPGSAYTFTDAAAPAGTTSEYEIAAQEDGLASDWSLPSNDAATPTVAPANLVVVRTDDGVVLQWDPVPGATQYTLYRQGPGGGGFGATVHLSGATTYQDPSPFADATYNYYVTATFPAGESAPSAAVGAQTLSSPGAGYEMFWDYGQAPQTPNATSSQAAGGAELGLQFWPYVDGYITGMQFYKGTLNTGSHVGGLWDPAGNLLATATFTNESQTGWQQVDFSQLVAVQGESGYYRVGYFDTSGYYAADPGYFAAQDVQTASGDMDAPAGTNGVEQFGATPAFPQQPDPDTANFWTQPVFIPASTVGGPPATPTGLTATAVSDAEIYLNWGGAPPGAATVTVLASGGGSQLSYTVPAGQTYCYVAGLAANTTYTVELVATNPAGSSDPSPPVSVTTLPVPAPTDLTATAASGTEIDLSWTDPSSGKTGFTIQWSPDDGYGNDWATLGTADPGVTSFKDAGLPYGSSRYYRVFATDAAGASAFSNDAWAQTPYTTPTIASPATAAQTTVTDTTDALSVLGALPDGPESALTYTWSVASGGPGGATFSPNGSNAAKDATVTFATAGTYILQATIRNGPASVTSSLQVTVNRTTTTIAVTPAAPAPIAQGATQQFSAAAFDQFGVAMSPTPTFTWSVASGDGTVDQAGLFTAPAQEGLSTVQAAADGVSGQAQVTVNDGSYLVTITGRAYESDFYVGKSSGDLAVTDTNWISAATPEDAVQQAISGTVTLNTPYDDGNATLSFPDDLGSPHGFAILGLTWDATNARYTGQIGMWDGDSNAPSDWDFYWNVTVTPKPTADLGIDADNNDGLGLPDHSGAEEAVEEDPTQPGKDVLIDDGTLTPAEYTPVTLDCSGVDPASGTATFSYGPAINLFAPDGSPLISGVSYTLSSLGFMGVSQQEVVLKLNAVGPTSSASDGTIGVAVATQAMGSGGPLYLADAVQANATPLTVTFSKQKVRPGSSGITRAEPVDVTVKRTDATNAETVQITTEQIRDSTGHATVDTPTITLDPGEKQKTVTVKVVGDHGSGQQDDVTVTASEGTKTKAQILCTVVYPKNWNSSAIGAPVKVSKPTEAQLDDGSWVVAWADFSHLKITAEDQFGVPLGPQWAGAKIFENVAGQNQGWVGLSQEAKATGSPLDASGSAVDEVVYAHPCANKAEADGIVNGTTPYSVGDASLSISYEVTDEGATYVLDQTNKRVRALSNNVATWTDKKS